MKESKTAQEQQELLSDDLFASVDKISLHGKKADSIVKNMLLHSHGTHGEKSLTDINMLCDEAINIAYENMRDKFPGFSCKVEKRFDKNCPRSNVIEQNISKVLWNLLSNAFYAVQKNTGDASNCNYH